MFAHFFWSWVLFGLISLFVSPVFAQEKILYLSFVDQRAIGYDEGRFVESLYREAYPEAEIIKIEIKDYGRLPKNMPAPREQMIGVFKERLKDVSEISHVVLVTHGGNRSQGGARSIYLAHIGSLWETGMGDQASAFLGPLIGKFKKDAKWVLNSCNTFRCGESEYAEIIRHLFSFLEIPSGQIYGDEEYYKSEAPLVKLSPYRILFLRFKGKHLSFLVAGVVMGVSLNGAASIGEMALKGVQNYIMLVGFYSGGVLASLLERRVFGRLRKATGKLIRFENGELKSVEKVHRGRDRERIYGLSGAGVGCRALFGG